MWSRLTEGLADIVAPEEGVEQQQDDIEELWSRIASVVAPLPTSPTSAGAAGNDEVKREQYIGDLQKKQNEAPENKLQPQRQSDEQEVETTSIERLPASRHDTVTLQTEEGEMFGLNHNRLVHELHQSQTQVDALTAQCQAHEEEFISLRDRVKDLQAANETLRSDKRETRSRLLEYEQGYVELLAEVEKMKAVNEEEKALLMVKSEEHVSSIDSQRLYDLEARLKTSEADKVVAQQDAERLQRELDALEGVLHQFQVDNKAQKERVIRVEADLERTRRELKAHQPVSKPASNDLERVIKKLAKKTRECERLREALESAATQYNSERDVLDKRLAAQLVVAYVRSGKKDEVLRLMARIMGFTEDQKRRVGVDCPIEGSGGGGIFSSIIGLVVPGEGGTTPVDPSTIEGKNFADVWFEYLLEEASKGQ